MYVNVVELVCKAFTVYDRFDMKTQLDAELKKALCEKLPTILTRDGKTADILEKILTFLQVSAALRSGI